MPFYGIIISTSCLGKSNAFTPYTKDPPYFQDGPKLQSEDSRTQQRQEIPEDASLCAPNSHHPDLLSSSPVSVFNSGKYGMDVLGFHSLLSHH